MEIPDYFWITPTEIASLASSGDAYTNVLKWSNYDFTSDIPYGANELNLSNQDSFCNTITYAKALMHVKNSDSTKYTEVENALKGMMGTEYGNGEGRTLGLGRNFLAFVISANIIDLKANSPIFNNIFEEYIRYVSVERLTFDGKTESIKNTFLNKPNNWGNAAFASLCGIYAYLKDYSNLSYISKIFGTWMGENSFYDTSLWKFKQLETDTTWQADPDNPLGINPLNATIDGNDMDGCIPDDARRAGDFDWPPPVTNYYWSASHLILNAANILNNCDVDILTWADAGISRIFDWAWTNYWITSVDDTTPVTSGTGVRYFPGSSAIDGLKDDVCTIYLANSLLETSYPTSTYYIDSSLSDDTYYYGLPQKQMGFFEWTHP